MPLFPAPQYPAHPIADPSPVRMREEIFSEGRGLLALSAGLLEAISTRLGGGGGGSLQLLMIKHTPLFYCISSKLAG